MLICKMSVHCSLLLNITVHALPTRCVNPKGDESSFCITVAPEITSFQCILRRHSTNTHRYSSMCSHCSYNTPNPSLNAHTLPLR